MPQLEDFTSNREILEVKVSDAICIAKVKSVHVGHSQNRDRWFILDLSAPCRVKSVERSL